MILSVDIFTIIAMAVALAMDAFAVSIVSGGTYEKLHVKHAFRVATFFGGFQAVMPIVGYFCGLGFKEYVTVRFFHITVK